MFYVKTKLNDDSVLEVDITRDNVFCRCPICGAEIQVHTDRCIADADFNEPPCEDCGRKVMEGVRK